MNQSQRSIIASNNDHLFVPDNEASNFAGSPDPLAGVYWPRPLLLQAWGYAGMGKAGYREGPGAASLLSTIVVLLALLGCASAWQAPAVIPEFRGAAVTETDPRLYADVLALDPAILGRLRDAVDARAPARQRLLQIVSLMRLPEQLGLRYSAVATRTAAETFHTGDGNCLALSTLFVALAREAGLDARFQDVELLPSWRQDGDVFVIERHINAVVDIGGTPVVVDFLVQGPDRAAYSRLIPDSAMMAQYFNNIGVEHLAAGRLALAYAFFRRSIELAPDTGYLWTNLGVVLARNGQLEEARQAYARALRLDRHDAVALNNLAGLYQSEGSGELERASLARVERLRLSNPYFRYWQADRFYQSGDLDGAIRELRAAIDLRPDAAAFHFALSHAYLRAGEQELAERSLAQAQHLTTDPGAREWYETQYRLLQRAEHDSSL